LSGEFRKWTDQYLCNQVDFYLSGHDHNRQWLQAVPHIPTWPPNAPDRVPCDTHFAVSGAGAKTDELQGRGNELDFGSEELGFLLLEFTRDRVRVEFCDADGAPEWAQEFAR
jgi:hypothetical protein